MNPAVQAETPSGVLVHPGRDLAALEEFAYQFLCEAASPARVPPGARLRAAALNPARLARAETPGVWSRIPLAYQIWLDYLFELDTLLPYVHLDPRALTALELQGLLALARARTRFLRRHIFCPHCDAPSPRSAQRCAHCHKEL